MHSHWKVGIKFTNFFELDNDDNDNNNNISDDGDDDDNE